jgi:5'-3' exonuclease
MTNNALVIDGHNFLFRGFFGVPTQVKYQDGTPINAVYGFFSLLRAVINELHPQYLIIVFDSETSSDKKKSQAPEYKSNRTSPDPGIFVQLSIIKKCLDILKIYWVENDDYEADDVIGSYSNEFSENRIGAYICSNDHDFFQLVGQNIFVVRGGKGEVTVYDTKKVTQQCGVPPTRYLDYLALVGDPTDNLSGVKGIGKQRAVKIISTHETLGSIYDSPELLPSSLQKKLSGLRQQLESLRAFLQIDCNIHSKVHPMQLESYVITSLVPEKMGAFLKENWNRIAK